MLEDRDRRSKYLYAFVYKFDKVLRGQGSGAGCRQKIRRGKSIDRLESVAHNRFHCFPTPMPKKKRAARAHTRGAASML